MSYLISADIHLKPETEDVVFQALTRMSELAEEWGVLYLALLGDIYDIRYTVPIRIQNRFLDWVEAEQEKREVLILPGNHDQDDAAGRHALEVFRTLPDVQVMSEPVWNEHGLWLPYRRQPLELAAFVEHNPRPEGSNNIAWLHHGIVGALMNDHRVAGELDGIDPHVFEPFDVVFCGHWHRHQEVQNCVYVGSPWQTRADEAGQEKGFIHLDEEGWEFVPIHVGRRHHRVHVGDGGPIARGSVQSGDVVHVVLENQDDAARVVSEFASVGVEARVQPPKQEYGGSRLGLGEAGSEFEYAEAFAKEHAPDDLDQRMLLDLLKEIAS